MEPKFFHERLKNPRTDAEIFELCLAISLWRYDVSENQDGQPIIELFFARDMEEAAENYVNFMAMNHEISHVVAEFIKKKPDFVRDLGSKISMLLSNGKAIQGNYRNMCLAFWLKYPQYTIQPDFYATLKKAKLKNLDWSMIPRDFVAAIRLPMPEHYRVGKDSVRISEITASIVDWDNGTELSILFSGINADNKKEVGMSVNTFIPESGPIDIKFETDDSSILNIAIRLFAYISSGQPDIREMKNPIRYQSPTSKTPVKAHKHLTEKPFKVLGWGWLKERQQHIDRWGVEPFIRLQPVGPGRSEYKYVLVRAHTRGWRKSDEVESKLEQAIQE